MNKTFKAFLATIIFMGCSLQGHSQVLIALLFGDKLNSDKLEFGIALGNSFSTQTNFSGPFSGNQWRLKGWNVGLWFNVKLDKKGRWYAHPGAIPKSTLGFRYLPAYATIDSNINAVIDSFNFDAERKVNYIHVPLLVRYRVFTMERKPGKKNSLFIQAGPQISLRTKAKDIFSADVGNDNTLTFDNDLTDEIRRFDVSISTGLVWKFRKALELEVSYNQGFLDIDKEEATGTNRNQFVMVNVNIPVGAGKKEKAAEGTGEKQAPVEKEAKPKKEKKSKEKTQ